MFCGSSLQTRWWKKKIKKIPKKCKIKKDPKKDARQVDKRKSAWRLCSHVKLLRNNFYNKM